VKALSFCLVVLTSAWAVSLTSLAKPAPPATLQKPLGILIAGGVIREVMPAGKELPATYSESFGNYEDNQKTIKITLVQSDASGQEIVMSAFIDNLPPRAKGKLVVIVTVKVDAAKQLRLKAMVPDSGYVKEIGPLPVT
jgi:molecular chaperone DnaK (HSP70)